jgi:hypothetical protein
MLILATFLFVVVFPTIADSATINLYWRDNSNNEAGFYVERRQGNGSQPFIKVLTVPTNTKDVSIPVDTFNTRLCYRIVAFNSAGNAAPSNSKCVQINLN